MSEDDTTKPATETTAKVEEAAPVKAPDKPEEVAKPEVNTDALAALTGTVNDLVEKVASLTEQITSLAPAQSTDTTPTGRPWTHRGSN